MLEYRLVFTRISHRWKKNIRNRYMLSMVH